MNNSSFAVTEESILFDSLTLHRDLIFVDKQLEGRYVNIKKNVAHARQVKKISQN